MDNLLDRITIDDEVCNGRPTIRGHRLTVQTIIEFILAGSTEDELFEVYPFLEKADIDACKRFTIGLMDRHFTIGSKQQLISELAEAIQELNVIEQGKKQARPLSALLNELR